ncbi:MAG: M1 family aminopeptidase, partial [Balneolales bacterium]
GNMVTAYDWRDFWIHEGFCTYMQPLFAEQLRGKEQYHTFMEAIRLRITNTTPVAPRESKSTKEMYSGQDVYMKGAWFLHTLRYLIGDDKFFEALRTMSYPDPKLEKVTDGSQTRFATTDDFLAVAEDVSNRELDWLFEVYLRQAQLPELNQEREGKELKLSWSVKGDLKFPMPVEIIINGSKKRIQIPGGGVRISIEEGDDIKIDPNHWILREL